MEVEQDEVGPLSPSQFESRAALHGQQDPDAGIAAQGVLAMQGSAGLELAWAQRPDLILLDLHLPDMTGEDVLHRLQADPATASIPVVVLSADATTSQVRTPAGRWRAWLHDQALDVRAFLAIVTDHLTSKETPGG
jgi:CheY-like chemotaxis protein